MAKTWQLQHAKNRFSELLDDAQREGPQTVTRRGIPAAIVVSAEEYRMLVRGGSTLVEFLESSPLHGLDLALVRSDGQGRGGSSGERVL